MPDIEIKRRQGVTMMRIKGTSVRPRRARSRLRVPPPIAGSPSYEVVVIVRCIQCKRRREIRGKRDRAQRRADVRRLLQPHGGGIGTCRTEADKGMTKLVLVPVTLDEANTFIRMWHRHHKPVPGAKFCIGASVELFNLVGVIVVGRPVARHYQDGWTLEVTRCATDGTKNASSMLYGAARRATFALGYRRLITYTRETESGASIRAAGWREIARRQARSWKQSSVARPREDQSEPAPRLLWEAQA